MTSAEKLASKVEDFNDDLEDELDDALQTGMRSTTQKAIRNVRRNDSIAHGNLIGSIEFERGTDTTFVNASKKVLSSARTHVDSDYAAFVEYGTGTFQQATPDGRVFPSPDPKPPLGKIRQWIIRKGITADNPDFRRVNLVQNEEFTDARGETTTIYSEQSQLAWAIANKIGAVGNRPHPFARPAARYGFDETVGRSKRAMSKSLRRF